MNISFRRSVRANKYVSDSNLIRLCQGFLPIIGNYDDIHVERMPRREEGTLPTRSGSPLRAAHARRKTLDDHDDDESDGEAGKPSPISSERWTMNLFKEQKYCKDRISSRSLRLR